MKVCRGLTVPAVALLVCVLAVRDVRAQASDRLLTLELLPVLWQKGYRYFAAEAFDWHDSLLNRRPYAASGTSGGYVDEPVFGEIVREARRLGFTLVPYEMEPEQDVGTDSLNPQQRRDRAQARNLNDRIFRVDPNAKVLVHAGYAHIKERADSTWSPMAAYLRALTGIDPVTVDQTMLAEMSEPAKEHPAYRALQAAGLVNTRPVILVDRAGKPLRPASFDVDFQVLTPPDIVRARPAILDEAGYASQTDRRAGSRVCDPPLHCRSTARKRWRGCSAARPYGGADRVGDAVPSAERAHDDPCAVDQG